MLGNVESALSLLRALWPSGQPRAVARASGRASTAEQGGLSRLLARSSGHHTLLRPLRTRPRDSGTSPAHRGPTGSFPADRTAPAARDVRGQGCSRVLLPGLQRGISHADPGRHRDPCARSSRPRASSGVQDLAARSRDGRRRPIHNRANLDRRVRARDRGVRGMSALFGYEEAHGAGSFGLLPRMRREVPDPHSPSTFSQASVWSSARVLRELWPCCWARASLLR